MESLVFKYKLRSIVKIVVLGLTFITLVLYIVLSIGSFDLSDLAETILLSSIWIVYFFFSSDKSRIGSGENCLKIKWVNWFREKAVPDTRIEKIVLGRQFVSISREEKKPIKLALESLEKEDKTKIYEFLIEYSKQRNINLERNLSS